MSRKVVFIESASDMGGVEFSTLYLASRLDPKQWNVVVTCPGEGKLASACRGAGVRVEIIPMPALLSTSVRIGRGDLRLPNPFSWIWNMFLIAGASNRVRKFLLQERADLILTKGMSAHFWGGLAAKRTESKCIWHVQDLISERYGRLYRYLFGVLAQLLPDGIVVDGTPIADQLPDNLRDKITVILNGVDTDLFRPGLDKMKIRRELGLEPGQVVIGHAARITPWKGQHHLLEAFGKIADQFPKACLLLVGSALFDNDVYEKRLRARVNELGLNKRVIFTGFREDLANVLAGMDIFAYPSVEKDTSPLSLISAMACGLPVVAFDINGVHEVLDDAGLLVRVGSTSDLVSSLASLIRDPLMRSHFGEAARQRTMTHFSLECHLANMQGIFERYGK